MKNLLKYIFFILSILFLSCSQDYNKSKTQRLLIKYNWRLINFVDYDANISAEFRPVDFYFFPDGSFMKIYTVGNDTIKASWALSPDGELLTIGSNTFRITTITPNVLSLRYGNLEMFFKTIPKE